MIKDEPLERKSFCMAVTRAGSLTAASAGGAWRGLRRESDTANLQDGKCD